MRTARIQNAGGRLPLARRFTALHARLYRRSGGRLGKRWFGARVMVLETTGRRTGRTRATPVLYVPDGDDLLAVPANAGNDRVPAWWLNLQAHPKAVAVVGGKRRSVVARLAGEAEAGRRWAVYRRAYARVDEYREFTERDLPLVVLEPIPDR